MSRKAERQFLSLGNDRRSQSPQLDRFAIQGIRSSGEVILPSDKPETHSPSSSDPEIDFYSFRGTMITPKPASQNDESLYENSIRQSLPETQFLQTDGSSSSQPETTSAATTDKPDKEFTFFSRHRRASLSALSNSAAMGEHYDHSLISAAQDSPKPSRSAVRYKKRPLVNLSIPEATNTIWSKYKSKRREKKKAQEK